MNNNRHHLVITSEDDEEIILNSGLFKPSDIHILPNGTKYVYVNHLNIDDMNKLNEIYDNKISNLINILNGYI